MSAAADPTDIGRVSPRIAADPLLLTPARQLLAFRSISLLFGHLWQESASFRSTTYYMYMELV